ncbi:hypothetical protein [Bacillus sp. UMB0893]|uniref:hypothetical protein n=1 Tax=Bacillus sp. UMB0893 TaxID=2066053 RepID=UPI000C755AC5|nr:hypothetical protein [Bacillus sp. UMB0893]PLR67727.1 hypothetical protein CYJ36_10355 [Bacillus sp. UMB0893]
MKIIQCLEDFKSLTAELSDEFLDYLKSEFYSLYEYHSNGECIKEFQLENHQTIVIVEEPKELEALTQSKLGLEYIEEITIGSVSCLRIGFFQSEDVQLFYFLKK